MQDNMMMADVLSIVNVSGIRIATPFAPPKPGSTPISTPSVTPTNITSMLNGVNAILKPCRSEWISSKGDPPSAEFEPGFDRPFRQRRLEPYLEEQKKRDRHCDRNDDGLPPR